MPVTERFDKTLRVRIANKGVRFELPSIRCGDGVNSPLRQVHLRDLARIVDGAPTSANDHFLNRANEMIEMTGRVIGSGAVARHEAAIREE